MMIWKQTRYPVEAIFPPKNPSRGKKNDGTSTDFLSNTYGPSMSCVNSVPIVEEFLEDSSL